MMATRAANSLVVTQQPVSVFYKDEGGRSNFLCAHIALPASYQGAPVRLTTSLYFECGRRVEEQDQDILSLLDFKYAPAVVAPGKPCVLRYRLEKVSRRKDNQRFKVLVEVDKAAAAGTPAAKLGSVFTNPVSVLSKRKTGERFVVRRNPSPQQRMKEFTATLRSIVGTLVAKVDTLQASIEANTAAVTQQGERLERLEAMMSAPQQVRFLTRGAGAGVGGASVAGGDVPMSAADVERDVAALEDDNNMRFLSSLWDVAGDDTQSTAAQRATFGGVPPVTRSLSKELIEEAVAASLAMGGAGDDGWAAPSAGLKRSRATAGLMTSPAGGSGEDSPRSDGGAPRSPPLTEARPPLPRLKLIGRKAGLPKVRRWRSMEIMFTRRPGDAAAALRRPTKRRATANLVLA